ncbi:MAG: hypothetical protein KGI05_00730 [Thaumarchaeota archaeon]|nr:hypothetical protein [Nitrososphaerota archaeon]
MSENLVIDGLKIAIPLLANNHKTILEKIKSGYKRIKTKHGSIEGSVYLTTFADFKPNYPLDSVNEHVCQMLMQFQMDEDSDCTYKYNKTNFSIIRQFNYAENFYFENEIIENSFENEILENNEELDFMVPLVNGLSIYCFPDGDDMKSQLVDGYNLTQFMQQELMKKYDIKNMKSFVYVEFTNEKDFSKIKHEIYKKQNELEPMKNLSHKKNELKLKMDALAPVILGEVL